MRKGPFRRKPIPLFQVACGCEAIYDKGDWKWKRCERHART